MQVTLYLYIMVFYMGGNKQSTPLASAQHSQILAQPKEYQLTLTNSHNLTAFGLYPIPPNFEIHVPHNHTSTPVGQPLKSIYPLG